MESEIVHGDQLALWVQRRSELIDELYEWTRQQSDAIDGGRMSELMNVLAKKQPPLRELSDLSNKVATQADVDPERRSWSDPTLRQRTIRLHKQSEERLLELIQFEKECEQRLAASRDDVQRQMTTQHSKQTAVNRYASVSAGYQTQQFSGSSGDSLDLSSD
ncbi:hypothetical protein [Crateriforma conspicua]|uniref:FlgN protein n=1 Tax=Crateriforma conspicua TaxID=2527996 RepID=A0A5C5Y6L1_9PLAN|nr:hypothetical protein [Crateriforma conspicua]QDV65887.1 hypothetical protein Mal65_50600 [Crateriforma conspicua]TWT71287.1 hypothetical protein Pan14r_35970 [Crateriforma conspicua]